MNNLLISAFEKAEKGWHTIASIMVPYMSVIGILRGHSSGEVWCDCFELARARLLKVRINHDGKIEFKLAQ